MRHAGGLLYRSGLLYAIAQAVTAMAWNPPYSWRRNYLSDLGYTGCGMFAVPHAVAAFVCSPRRLPMNASFMFSGGLIIVATVLPCNFWPTQKNDGRRASVWLISGLGKITVGSIPENTHIVLHTIAALNVLAGNIAILLLSVTLLRERKALALLGFGLCLVGILATALSIAAQCAGPALLLGFGSGGMERLADYPACVWLALAGIHALAAAFGHASCTRRHTQPCQSLCPSAPE